MLEVFDCHYMLYNLKPFGFVPLKANTIQSDLERIWFFCIQKAKTGSYNSLFLVQFRKDQTYLKLTESKFVLLPSSSKIQAKNYILFVDQAIVHVCLTH